MGYLKKTLCKKQEENKVRTATTKNLTAFLGYKNTSSISRASLTKSNGLIVMNDKFLLFVWKRARREKEKQQNIFFLASYTAKDAVLQESESLLSELSNRYSKFVDPDFVEVEKTTSQEVKEAEEPKIEDKRQCIGCGHWFDLLENEQCDECNKVDDFAEQQDEDLEETEILMRELSN